MAGPIAAISYRVCFNEIVYSDGSVYPKDPPSIRDCDFCSVPHLSTCLVYGDIEGLRTVDAGICMPCYMNYMEKRCGQESS